MPVSAPPSLQHPEINALFEYGLDIPDSVLGPILALPRESLIADLEALVLLAEGQDIENQEETVHTWFPFHALMLLGELRSEQSLPLVLDLLRWPDDDLNFWFGDMPSEDFWGITLWCGLNRIPELVEFIKDQSVSDDFMRGMAVDVLEQIAFHFPERREEMVQTLGDLLAWFNDLETFDEEDVNAATSVTNALADLEATAYLPLIGELFEKDRVDEMVRGDWEMYQAEFGDTYNLKRPLWHTYREWLDTRGEDWRKMIAQNELYALEAEKRRLEKELQQKKQEARRKQIDLKNALLQKHRLASGGHKIGRNDPCPCGSGKKYKRCCGASV